MSRGRRLIRALKTVHLWIGLILGLHFVLIATTGAIYIFQPELSAFGKRHLKSTPGDVGPDRVVEAVRAQYPDWQPNGLEFPTANSPFYAAYLPPEDDSETVYFWTDVLIDPGTGNVVGEIDNAGWNIHGLLQIAIQLHIHLCAGETGRLFVDYSVAVFTVTLLIGTVLWWPGIRRFGHGFVMRLRRNRFVANYDWHRVTGILALPFLLVMAITGLLWGFPEVVRPVVFAVCGETPTPPFDAQRLQSSDPADANTNALPLSAFAERARSTLPDSRLLSIWVDADPRGTAHAYLKVGRTPYPEGTAQEVYFDKYTGDVLHVSDHRELSMAESLMETWSYPLHYGSFGGLPTKILYLLATLAVVGLYVTGVVMWWIKRKKRRLGHSVTR